MRLHYVRVLLRHRSLRPSEGEGVEPPYSPSSVPIRALLRKATYVGAQARAASMAKRTEGRLPTKRPTYPKRILLVQPPPLR